MFIHDPLVALAYLCKNSFILDCLFCSKIRGDQSKALKLNGPEIACKVVFIW